MSYGLTPTGFNRKPYSQVLADCEARARNLYGANVNLNENSPLGIFIRIVAFFIASGNDSQAEGLWELAEKVYFSGYVDTAAGNSLDGVGKYIGVTRRLAEKATGSITVSGTNGTNINVGALFATTDGIQFEATSTGTISGGTATINIRAIEAGINGNVPANTITVITNPIAGVTSVTNATEITGGRDIETDEAFRQRYDDSFAKVGASTTDSILATLLATPGVISAIVRNNDTSATVGGLPAKCIAPVVYGGTDTDAAQAIFSTKAGGIQSFGTTTVNVTDLSGNTHAIGFTRPTEVDIYVNITLTTNSNFPADGEDKVSTEIIKYIGGTDADATEYSGLGLGETVIWSKCIAAVQNISGITDVVLELSTDNITFTPANVAITSLQIAKTDNGKVVIL